MLIARSIRILYRNQQGTIRQNFNWGPINLDSAVIITAAQFNYVDPGQVFTTPNKTQGRPWLGAANVYVTNVGPHNPEGGTGGVEFLLHVDWGTPLDVIVTITVLDNIEEFVQL